MRYSDPPPPGTCGWPTGTAFTGPARCGKPAKQPTPGLALGDIKVPEVCGIHLRRAANASYDVSDKVV